MRVAETRTGFWALTGRTAKKALYLYFDPMRRLGALVSARNEREGRVY
jgi:hypothetical protein